MWLPIALVGFTCGAIVNILDKFILSTKKVAPSVFVFYSTAVLLPLLILAPFKASFGVVWPLLPILVLAAAGFFIGLYTMYRSELTSEVSHVGPLIGAIVPLGVIGLSRLFLNESLAPRELAAAALLIIGSLVISFEVSREHFGWHRGMLFAVVAGLAFAVFHVASKYAYSALGFVPSLLWIWGLMSLPGLALLFASPVRAAIFNSASAAPALAGAAAVTPALSPPAHQASWVFSNKLLSIAATLLIQYAVALGSVSLVNALTGVQYGLLIILVAVLSKFSSRFVNETYGRGEIVQEGVAVALIALGLVLLVG